MTQHQANLLADFSGQPAPQFISSEDLAAIRAVVIERADLLAACEAALGFFIDSDLDGTWLAGEIRAAIRKATGGAS